eukprot:scaffold1682_cov154-Skeletonema_marinoi.AAC.2
MSAHDASFRCMAWSHNQNYLLTSDGGGNIKYWSPSIAPVQSIDSHDGQAIHALSFSPADTKFVSCGDDATVRIWDWAGRREERVLEGHGWDVKCVQWHPRSSVICSGSKDNLVKLWDPRQGGCLSTLYGHKNTVTKVAWNDNGNWLLTASRDQLIKLYDIRAMKELCSLKGHHKEVTSIAWHPIYETVFASGGMDGTLIYWNVGPKGSEEPAVKIPFAHDMAIWDMKWHPAGHLLATGSNDRQTKFFARNRPGMKQGLDDDGLEVADGGAYDNEIIQAEMELGNHVGIVIGRRGATIIAMQRQTKTKMHVDQIRRVLQIEGTARQIETVKKRVGALLDRVSSDNEDRGQGGVIVYSPYQLFLDIIIYAASVKRLPLPCPCLPECKWFNLYARGGFAAGRGFTAQILHHFAINYDHSLLYDRIRHCAVLAAAAAAAASVAADNDGTSSLWFVDDRVHSRCPLGQFGVKKFMTEFQLEPLLRRQRSLDRCAALDHLGCDVMLCSRLLLEIVSKLYQSIRPSSYYYVYSSNHKQSYERCLGVIPRCIVVLLMALPSNQASKAASCFNSTDKMENPCQCHCVAAALLFGLRLFADRSTSAKQLCCEWNEGLQSSKLLRAEAPGSIRFEFHASKYRT